MSSRATAASNAVITRASVTRVAERQGFASTPGMPSHATLTAAFASRLSAEMNATGADHDNARN